MFERFTDRLRLATVRSVEQARSLGSPTIQPEHTLIALVETSHDIPVYALRSQGVDERELATTLAGMAQVGPPPPEDHVPFSDIMKGVLEDALRESLRLRHNSIGTGHMLLALIGTTERGAALPTAWLLARLGVDGERTAEHVVRFHPMNLDETPQRPLPAGERTHPTHWLDAAAHDTLQQAQREACATGLDEIGTEHVLLALSLRTADPAVGTTLAEAGVDHATGLRLLREQRPVLPVSPHRRLPLMDRVQLLVVHAQQLAERRGHDAVEPGHLLAALAVDRDCVGSKLLMAQGADLETVGARALDRLGPHPAGTAH
ncbi:MULTISPECIES: Clp protease N-terminal domain-containing protein [unclassified Streptomyces]|uniref:Clp protease N-terminal domain-containing protein n=1 Tax=unclassified Streptomyces TaxID=2593676 RepID=UPI0015E1A2F5|nr:MULTISPECIES: Clp protease N-terminal domain-containing protein [unclassified Streptomyces]